MEEEETDVESGDIENGGIMRVQQTKKGKKGMMQTKSAPAMRNNKPLQVKNNKETKRDAETPPQERKEFSEDAGV